LVCQGGFRQSLQIVYKWIFGGGDGGEIMSVFLSCAVLQFGQVSWIYYEKGGVLVAKKSEDLLCTTAQMEMIEHYMAGWTKERSFREAFPDRNPLASIVFREFAKPEVQAEIKRQQDLLRESKKTELNDLTLLWSREKAVQTYMDLITGAQERMQNMAENSRDYAALAKVVNDSASSIGKMLGYDAPIKLDTDNKVVVQFNGGASDEAGADDWTG
jgi:hypothetical protein